MAGQEITRGKSDEQRSALRPGWRLASLSPATVSGIDSCCRLTLGYGTATRENHWM